MYVKKVCECVRVCEKYVKLRVGTKVRVRERGWR